MNGKADWRREAANRGRRCAGAAIRFLHTGLCALLCTSCALINSDDTQHMPHGVALAPASMVTPFSVQLSWNKTSEADRFVAYKVFFSCESGVCTSDEFATSIPYRSDTTCILTGFEPDSTYYFRVFVCGQNHCAGSNEIAVTTTACSCGTFSQTRNGSAVLIPAGCFVDAGGYMAVMSHALYIDTTEVTEQEWNRIMKSDTCQSLKPRTRLTWYDCILYCNARSKAEGLDTCYQIAAPRDTLSSWGDTVSIFECSCEFLKNGYRLPTEDEWEYAYRAGSTTPFFWTNACSLAGQCSYPSTPADTQEVSRHAWWYANRTEGEEGPRTVAQKLPNGFGLYDMAGNVMEHVWDRYAKNQSGRPAENRVDYRGLSSGPLRLVRGGCYTDGGEHVSASRAELNEPLRKRETAGFRVVRTYVQ